MWKGLLVAAAVIAGTVQAGAVELHLLVGGAMSEPFHEVAEAFEKKTGHHIAMTVDNTGALQRRLSMSISISDHGSFGSPTTL